MEIFTRNGHYEPAGAVRMTWLNVGVQSGVVGISNGASATPTGIDFRSQVTEIPYCTQWRDHHYHATLALCRDVELSTRRANIWSHTRNDLILLHWYVTRIELPHLVVLPTISASHCLFGHDVTL